MRPMQKIQPRKGEDTRGRILDAAEASVLEKGFAATSIEELIAAVGITKSGFFYHFKDKGELAKALLTRYIEHEDALFDELFAHCTASWSG
jgi:TetR/AcrR family transcriptional regulator, transcriptional repressor for nem operon